MVAQTLINHIIFWKSVMKTFIWVYVNLFNRLKFLAEIRTKLQKWTIFHNINTITQEDKIYFMFCPSLGDKYPFFRLQLHLMTICVLIEMVFVTIWETFHGRVSLNSVLLLLLLVDFLSDFRFDLMYTSFIASIRSSITYLHGFQLLVLLP